MVYTRSVYAFQVFGSFCSDMTCDYKGTERLGHL